MSTNNVIGFPDNPSHGDIFEYKEGLYFQYDGRYNSWVAIRSNDSNVVAATTLKKGAMSAGDLQKLNRLVLPVPNSTLTFEDCDSTFNSGVINIYGGDRFIDIQGNLDIQNLDEYGDLISQKFPFKIHQHTNGFDFTLNLDTLVKELIDRSQIILKGMDGGQGPDGAQGDNGLDKVPAGPRGDIGATGNAPECSLSIEEEIILSDTAVGLNKALVDVRVKVNESDPTKYSLEFDRQEVGVENYSATKFDVGAGQSSWVMAVESVAAGPQPVHYFDVDPIVDAIKAKYDIELKNLKQQYENITTYWVQKMSDLFDEQKSALCCALEYCRSVTKSTQLRQHMESVASAALPDARINVSERGSGEEVSSTKLLPKLPGGSDLCGNSAQAASLQIPNMWEVDVDPIIHTGNSKTAYDLELPAGRYTAIISEMMVKRGDKYGLPIKIEYINEGKRSTSFLNKGQYDNLSDARNAYEGLSLGFRHAGGSIKLYYPILPSSEMSGRALVTIKTSSVESFKTPTISKAKEIQPQVVKQQSENSKQMEFSISSDKLKWLSESWLSGKCCGVIINMSGQDFIIIKRSVGDDASCGGGGKLENYMRLADEQLGAMPAIAWPTLDGKTFAPIVNKTNKFVYDVKLNKQFANLIDRQFYLNPVGNPNGSRHLAYQLSVVLFPKMA